MGEGPHCPRDISSSTNLSALMAPENLGWFRMLGIGTSFLAFPLENRKTNLHQQDETILQSFCVWLMTVLNGVTSGSHL